MRKSIFLFSALLFIFAKPCFGEVVFSEKTANGTYVLEKIENSVVVNGEERKHVPISFILLEKESGTEIIARVPWMYNSAPFVSMFVGERKIWVVQWYNDLQICEIPKKDSGIPWKKQEKLVFIGTDDSTSSLTSLILPGTDGILMKDVPNWTESGISFLSGQPIFDLESVGVSERYIRVSFQDLVPCIEAKISGEWVLVAKYNESKSVWDYVIPKAEFSNISDYVANNARITREEKQVADTSAENNSAFPWKWLALVAGTLFVAGAIAVVLRFRGRRKRRV